MFLIKSASVGKKALYLSKCTVKQQLKPLPAFLILVAGEQNMYSSHLTLKQIRYHIPLTVAITSVRRYEEKWLVTRMECLSSRLSRKNRSPRSEPSVTIRPAQPHLLLFKHDYNVSFCTDHHQATITKALKIRQNTFQLQFTLLDPACVTTAFKYSIVTLLMIPPASATCSRHLRF